MTTMLSVVQDFFGRQNLPVPTTVYGTTDPQVLQVMKLLEEEGNDLSQRNAWQGLINEASVTTIGLDDQGAMSSLASNGFRYILNDTIWSRTRRLPVCGPLDPVKWQMLQALFVSGPYYRYRIRQNHLLVNPTPPVGESWYFEYVSYNWITDSTGAIYRNRFLADTDLIVLPGDLTLQGLRWRWLREKGMDYAELFRTYEMQVKDAMGRDGGKPILAMDGGARMGPQPGIFVPTGSWDL